MSACRLISSRYELFWLPLLAQSTTTAEIEMRLDVAWVWQVHMLSPVSYKRDCNEFCRNFGES